MLSKTQQKWWSMIKPKSGVLMIYSRPGEGKTAMLEDLANKKNLRFIDLRLTQKDEAEVGCMPAISECKKYYNNVVPEWALVANEPGINASTGEAYEGVLIDFDELNSAQPAVRKGAFQLLNERKIGEFFKFNDNVYMCATGNFGVSDNTEVFEFCDALNGRLIHCNHELLLGEWIEGYAKKNVHPVIIDYLKAYPAEFYKRANEEDVKAYASARSWTNLSKFITVNHGESAPIKSFLNDLVEVGNSYIGKSISAFLRYCEEQCLLNIHDVINRFDQIKKEVSKFNRAKISELMIQLRELDFSEFTPENFININKFFSLVPKDETIPVIKDIVFKYSNNPNVKEFIDSNKELLKDINKHYKA